MHRKESLVSKSELDSLATKAGLKLKEKDLDDWSVLLSGLNQCAKEVLALEDYFPKVDYELYPRTDIHRPSPEEADKGGWAWKATVKSTKPKSDKLKGVRIALKDNVALAGVPCTNGTAAIPEWIPEVDATVVTRILDAGGIITGKSACENNCFGAVRYKMIMSPWQ
jgi:amidase